MKVGVHVDVPGPEVLLHHHLVLLCVPAAEDQVVLRRDEPVELLEPVHPARHLEAALVRLFVFRCVRGVCAVLNWCCTFLEITLLSIDPSCVNSGLWVLLYCVGMGHGLHVSRCYHACYARAFQSAVPDFTSRGKTQTNVHATTVTSP